MTPRAARRRRSSFLLLACRAFLVATALSPAAILVSTPAASAGVPPSCKVLPPVEVRLVPLDAAAPGSIARFTLEVVPRSGVPREVRVRWLPSSPDLVWVEGERSATRPAQRDERQAFDVAVRVPRSGQQVLHCQVEVVTESGTVWRRGVGVALGPEALAARGRLVPDGAGGTLLQFDAAPADRIAGGSR